MYNFEQLVSKVQGDVMNYFPQAGSYSHFTSDSHSCTEGSVYVCVEQNLEGRPDPIPEAIRRGAKVVIGKDYEILSSHVKNFPYIIFIHVGNPKTVFEALSQNQNHSHGDETLDNKQDGWVH